MGDLAIVIVLIGISAMLVADPADKPPAILINAVACACGLVIAIAAIVVG